MPEALEKLIANRYGGRGLPVAFVLPDGARVQLAPEPEFDVIARTFAGLRALASPAMGRLAAEMVRDALDAFAARDAEAAVAVCRRDRAVDDFYNSLFRTLLTYMMENPNNISPSTHLLFIAKNLERLGDHATNIAEIVHYQITGEEMPPERPKWDSLKPRSEGAPQGGALK